MDITPLVPHERKIIHRYGNGGFLIHKTAYKGSVVILADQVLPWLVEQYSEVSQHHFDCIFSASSLPEIVLIGTGKAFSPLSAELRQVFRERKIQAEAMDSGAACRTYNVLLAEERRVAAALIAV